jgi:hypothetical protein
MNRRLILAAVFTGSAACWTLQVAQAQQLGGGVEGGVSAFRVIGSLIVCLVLAVGLAFAIRGKRLEGLLGQLRGVRGKFGTRRIRRLESFRLSLNSELHIIQVDETEYLLLCSPAAQTILYKQSIVGEGQDQGSSVAVP